MLQQYLSQIYGVNQRRQIDFIWIYSPLTWFSQLSKMLMKLVPLPQKLFLHNTFRNWVNVLIGAPECTMSSPLCWMRAQSQSGLQVLWRTHLQEPRPPSENPGPWIGTQLLSLLTVCYIPKKKNECIFSGRQQFSSAKDQLQLDV